MDGTQRVGLERQTSRVFAGIVSFDLVMTISMVITWVVSGLVEPRVAVVCAVVRAASFAAFTRAELRPVRALHDRAEPSDDELLAADASLQRAGRRCAVALGVAWALTELVWLAAAVLDLPFEVPSGEAELVAGAMFLIAAGGLPAVAELVYDSALAGLRAEVGARLSARRLQPVRRWRSLARPLVATAVWLLVGLCLAFGGVALQWSANNARAQMLTTQQARADHSAERVEAGADPLEGVVVVDALAPELAAASERADDPLGFYNHRTDTCVAIRELDDGRLVVAAAAPAHELGLLIAIIGILIFVAGPTFGVAFWMFARMIVRPVQTFTATTRQFIEAGEVTGLEQIIAVRSDEVGELAASMLQMFEILAELTHAATAVSAGKLSVELEQPGALHDAFRGMLAHLNAIVARLRETAVELASAAIEISALSEQQEQAALVQSDNVQQLARTVGSLAEAAGQIAEAAGGVRVDAEQVQSMTDASAGEIAALRGHTASIAELLGSIAEIASRSDLLALNGSLEATRAGEAGRGFALVAAEMRRLAERVSGTVDDVREQIANVESSSERSVGASERSRELAGRTAAAARAIDRLTMDQSHDTEQASLGVQSTADMIVETTEALAQIRAATEGLRAHAVALESLLDDFELRDPSSP